MNFKVLFVESGLAKAWPVGMGGDLCASCPDRWEEKIRSYYLGVVLQKELRFS